MSEQLSANAIVFRARAILDSFESRLPLGVDIGLHNFCRIQICIRCHRLALFDLESPGKSLLRGDSWMVGPESEYERHGDVDVMSYSRVDTPWA
jgi:hypothetical protein